jgi:hypothetical protein
LKVLKEITTQTSQQRQEQQEQEQQLILDKTGKGK